MSKMYTWQQIARAIDAAYSGEPYKQKTIKNRVRKSVVAIFGKKTTSLLDEARKV